jgi:molybdate transport system substrate-binding protein
MSCPRIQLSTLLLIALLSIVEAAIAAESDDELRLAVASNFAPAMKEIATRFTLQSGQPVIVIAGSTGKHYAQITHGAPYDIFFAAGSVRPARLADAEVGVADSLYTYALGRLVLWSRQENLIDPAGTVPANKNFRHIAIANPKLAPYGQAAKEVLQQLDRWDSISSKLVRGENIAQTFQFVYSGNAELGFVARSQLLKSSRPEIGSRWDVPDDMHTPIKQQAILLVDSEYARRFMDFMKSTQVREIILAYGYDLPDDEPLRKMPRQ